MVNSKSSGRGRRAGKPDTRDTIVREARAQFAERGYADTSIRSVAAAAGVDPSLVTHFFTNKEGLFEAALGVLDALALRMLAALHGDLEGLPRRLAGTYLGLWEDPQTGEQLRAVFRSSISSNVAARIVQEGLAARATPEALRHLPSEVLPRLPIAIAQLLGVAISRYVFEIPGSAAPATGQLVDWLEPAIGGTLGLS